MLKFCNQYGSGIWLSIMYYEPACREREFGEWMKKGWWRLNPGECKVVYGGDLADRNRYYLFHAHADDGGQWIGPYSRFLPYNAFEWCELLACIIHHGPPCGASYNFRLLDINGYDHYTVDLVRG